MKSINQIIQAIIFTSLLLVVFISQNSYGKSINAGERVKILLTDSLSTKAEGKLLLKGADSVGIYHATSGSKYYGLDDIHRISAHRTFSYTSMTNGTGLGLLAGGGVGFLALPFDERTSYLEIIGVAIIGGWLGAVIGGLIGENVVYENEPLYIFKNHLEPWPDWIKSIDCGDRLEIFSSEHPSEISGNLFLKDSINIGLHTDNFGPKIFSIDNIKSAYHYKSNMRNAIGNGFGIGSFLGATIGFIYHLADLKGKTEMAELHDALPFAIFTLGGGLLGSAIGAGISSPDQKRINVRFLRSIPDCGLSLAKKGRSLEFGFYIKIE